MSEEKSPPTEQKQPDVNESQNSEEQHLLQEQAPKENEEKVEEHTSPKKSEEIHEEEEHVDLTNDNNEEESDSDTINFYLNLNLIKIINDETLPDDILFNKVYSQINLNSKNFEDIGIYIYINFLFRNSFYILTKDPKNTIDYQKTKNVCDFLDDKLSSFNFDKIMRNIKERELFFKNKQPNPEQGILFELVKKEIDDSDINPEKCCLDLGNNNYKLILNYNLISQSMYSKGQHDLFIKLYIIYLFNQNEILLPIVNSFIKLVNNKKFEPFDEETYLNYVDKILKENNEEEINKIIDNDLKEKIKYFIELNDKTSLYYLEKFLIQLLGNSDTNIRSKATVLLNIFYDGHILQLYEPFNPVIKYLKDDFDIIFTLEENINADNYFLFVSTPVRIFYVKNETNNLDEENNLIFNLGEFKYCGYYDYVLIKSDNFKPQLDTKGRYIVQNNDIKYLNCHSLLVDYHNLNLDSTSKTKKQGTYKDIINSINYFYGNGVNGLNLIGVLERDVYLSKSENVSPYSIINRSKICSLLGTEKDFIKLVDECAKMNIKVFVDMLSSISSSHYHKKYNNLNLNYVDKYGKLQCLFGTEGDSVNYEDNMILNYRDINSWNLLLNDIIELCEKYKISGIHLNNAQTWPMIYSIDLNEMFHEQVDNGVSTRHYSNFEIINGEVVLPNQECGYWNSFVLDENNTINNIYPNPLFIKLTKSIWEKYPEFIFIGEFINNNQKYNNRQFILGKSGLVTKINFLPEIFTHLYNINTGLDSIVNHLKKNSINDIIKTYYDYINSNLPLNSFFISSSGGVIWPYPNLLYGPGCLPYITALFTLNNIPMTFMNEIFGEYKRYQFCCYFDSIKTNEKEEVKRKKKLNINDYLTKYKVSEIEKQLLKSKSHKVGNNNQQVIKTYYEKMRILRQSHKSLLSGNLQFIKNDNDKLLSFIREDLDNNEIAFIIINFGETVSKLDLDFNFLLEKEEFQNLNINTIIKIENWDDSETFYYFMDEIFAHKHTINIMPYDSFMIGFSIVRPFDVELYRKTFSDSLIELCKKINDNLRNDANKTNKKKKKADTSLGKYNYDSNIISSQLKYLLKNNLSLCEFAKWLNTIQTILAEYNIQYLDYLNNLSFITENSELSTQYYKYVAMLNALPTQSFRNYPKISLFSEINQKYNEFGPICFVTPEIGKWTSTSDIGTMLYDLTESLSSLGQDVYVISIYYHTNYGDKSEYLENDKSSFIYLNDIAIEMKNEQYNFKIYFGKLNDVKFYFLYNKDIFPNQNTKIQTDALIKRILLFGKATMELLCHIQVFPSCIISNDYFSGLVPVFGKCNLYKDIFKYTSFIHIVYNTENNVAINDSNSLPKEIDTKLFMDKKNKLVFNPTQAALLTCDQWGTGCKAFKEEFLDNSEYKDIIKDFSRPFSCVNGINKYNKIEELKYMIKKVLLENNNTDGVVNINDIDIFNEDYKNKFKEIIQKKYFTEVDNNKLLLYFLGKRINENSGLRLILDNTEELIKKHNAQILITGKANQEDKYSVNCIQLIETLKKKYPKNFYSSTNEIFEDSLLFSYGSDFGLIPTSSDPVGLVQNEFFICSTPVIAHKAGGLKDCLTDYNSNKKIGNSFLYDLSENSQFLNTVSKAVKIFNNKTEYKKLCSNVFNSIIDVADSAKLWGDEFYRIKDKIFYDRNIVDTEKFLFKKNLKEEKKIFDEEMDIYNDKTYIFSIKEPMEEIKNDDDDDNEEGYLPISFIYCVEKGKKYKKVEITGSWDKGEKYNLYYDPLNNCWKTIIILPKGTKYFYKYILDDQVVINPNEKLDKDGHNNLIET